MNSSWYKVEKLHDGEGEKLMEVRNEEGIVVPVYTEAHLFERFEVDGKEEYRKVLLVACMDMERISYLAIERLRLVLEAQHICPVLILPPQVELLKLRELTSAEAETAKRKMQQQQIAKAEAANKDTGKKLVLVP